MIWTIIINDIQSIIMFINYDDKKMKRHLRLVGVWKYWKWYYNQDYFKYFSYLKQLKHSPPFVVTEFVPTLHDFHLYATSKRLIYFFKKNGAATINQQLSK